MCEREQFRALVVDDDAAVQSLTIRALKQQGFQCDTAADGREAEDRISQTSYDIVVTDLRMPNKHGHALAVHLLGLHRRPVIIVHTGVVEPKLTKDLPRGVDDILFKPCDFNLLAAKAKALAERRLPQPTGNRAGAATQCKPSVLDDGLQQDIPDGIPLTLSMLQHRLADVARLLPISTAALDVYRMTADDQTPATRLAAAIQRDAAFVVEVLRLANSSFYNASPQPIVELDRAVVRIGQKRIGELALGMNALAALTRGVVPWMDVALAWKQSMAAGLAVEMLIEQGGHQAHEDGLLLAAIMHPLGRLALATLFPRRYQQMIDECRLHGKSLEEQEQIVFPLDHAAVLGRVLATWNLPTEVQSPLSFILKDYQSLALTPEPSRTKAELIKLAMLIARLAVGRWETWDQVEIPCAAVLKRLNLSDLGEIIRQTRVDVQRLTTLSPDQGSTGDEPQSAQPLRRLCCCNLSGAAFDLLAALLPPMGIEPFSGAEDAPVDDEMNVLVNGVGASPQRLADLARRWAQSVIVAEAEQVERYRDFPRAITLPTSYRRLVTACWDISSPQADARQLARTLAETHA